MIEKIIKTIRTEPATVESTNAAIVEHNISGIVIEDSEASICEKLKRKLGFLY